MKKRIVHISTVHFPYDPRIVFRQCKSLAQHFEVILLIPNADAGLDDRIQFIALKAYKSLVKGLLYVHPMVWWKAFRLKADLYHLHDPELIPLGLVLTFFGFKVIYDVHENTRQQLKQKQHNNSTFFIHIFQLFDRWAERYLNLVLAEDSYLQVYHHARRPTTVIHNFADLSFFSPFLVPDRRKLDLSKSIDVFYIGGISIERCIHTIIKATSLLSREYPHLKIHLVGECYLPMSTIEKLEGFESARPQLAFYGKQNPSYAYEQWSKNALVGLALLQPVANYLHSYPSKLFEYLSIGLPVITSDFDLYKPIVENSRCGFCIPPNDANALANAIRFFIREREQAHQMAEHGRLVVHKNYTWNIEFDKLKHYYNELLDT